jgi:hypothetical protein
VNTERIELVPCPSCRGSTRRPLTHMTVAMIEPLAYRGKTQPCLSCKEHRGQVEAWRVCPTCGHWRDSCTCAPERGRIVMVGRRAICTEPLVGVKRRRGRPRKVSGAATGRQDSAPIPPPADSSPSCPWGLSGCELTRHEEGFWFCERCCWAVKER